MNQLFYIPGIQGGFVTFDEEESRHLLTVLRRKPGDRLQATDGRGMFYELELTEAGKKAATARIVSQTLAVAERPARLHIGIAPTKQIERIEWFLEKATEIGVDEVTLLLCQRSERTQARIDRLEKILVSAMKQSLRAYLPRLNPLTPFASVVQQAHAVQKRIAWCADTPLPHLKNAIDSRRDTLLLIGPEGDFTPEEVALAEARGFSGVSLGEARLRTETAGLLAVVVFNAGLE